MEYVLKLAQKAVLNKESEPWSGKVAAAANYLLNVEDENRPRESCHTSREDVITMEMKYAVKNLVAI